MKKRRITLNLDERVIQVLEAAGGRSLSDTANQALSQYADSVAHRRAALAWIDELNAEFGRPSSDDYAAADTALDEAFGSLGDGATAA